MSTRPVEADRIEDLFARVAGGDRRALARAITLVESRRSEDQEAASALMALVRARAGRSLRVGISGVPGAGKSTLIDALGGHLTGLGHKVAVLSVDPSSSRSGGSLLGDKLRMHRLTSSDRAYVRPSPSSGLLGGVARNTREAVLLCEAAGFDVVVIETVGTGQSEESVASVVDTFVLLVLAGAGDEVQAMKRGALELADVVVVTKADGDNVAAAERARGEHESAFRLPSRPAGEAAPPVLTVSAREGTGIDRLWQVVREHRERLSTSGALDGRRAAQRLAWFWERLERGLRERFIALPQVRDRLTFLESAVAGGELSPDDAASQLLAVLG